MVRHVRYGVASLIALSILCCLSCSRQDDPPGLRLHLQPGKTYTLHMTSEQMIVQDFPGRPECIRKALGMGFVFAVQKVDDEGTIYATVTIHSASLGHESGEQTIEYDSTRTPYSEIPPEAAGISLFIGEQFSLSMTSEGSIREIAGVEQMIEHGLDRLGISAGAERQAASQEFRNQFNEAVLKEMIGNLLAVYPDRPVRVGESWQKTSTITEGYSLFLEHTWTLQDLRNGRAIVKLISLGKPIDQQTSLQTETSKFYYDVHGNQEGSFELDAASGWIQRAFLTQTIQGRVILEGTQKLGQVVSWPIRIEGTVRLEPEEGIS
ncbi:MAG TPA: DUF6263 family protein [Thermodesulfobacteriota bacterium]|nr:DUF6263 family protein [Thermodesulfobacteriota bacterium]HNU73054.1 DUF6263 family protein [Thermodesulfobacteriota bacterium]HQO79326.1 DUF6263 family protein [Thermodesulfobacteriota bacterium]